MKRLAPHARRIASALVALTFCAGFVTTARAQLPTSEERLKILTDPEDVKKKLEKDKDKSRPPIELFRSQVAPFDILPFVKAKHWSTLTLEMRSNYEDYAGAVSTRADQPPRLSRPLVGRKRSFSAVKPGCPRRSG